MVERAFYYRNVPAPSEMCGTTFRPAEADELAAFDTLAQALTTTRDELLASGFPVPIGTPEPAVVNRLESFLTEPLTDEQRNHINEHGGAAVADFCIDVQDVVARVPIEESRQRLVHLPGFFESYMVPASFSNTPFHPACGEWAGKPREFWAREDFAERLLLMGALTASQGFQLHIEDAFRPVGVQEGLFKRRYTWAKNDHPDWTEEQLIAETRSKTATTPQLASHKGGAAVDARLRRIDDGSFLDIGHNYPDGGALVFSLSPYLTAEQWHNRQHFQLSAGLSGLTLYVGEDWHVSFGDNLAGLHNDYSAREGYTAQYGPLKDFDRTTGAVTETYAPDEMRTVFSPS